METPNYLDILIEGYCKRGNYFKDYLIGKIIEFEKMHISKKEFIERIGNEIDNCIKKINSSFEKLLLRYEKDSLSKKKNKIGYSKPYLYKIDIEDEQHPHIICLSPNALTSGKVKSPEFIYLSDFEQMKIVLKELTDIDKEFKDHENINKPETSHKTQILLLEKLGFFELETVYNLTTEKKGLLVSFLLNRNLDNSIDYIGNKYEKVNSGSKKSPYNKHSEKQLKNILSQLNIVK